MTKPINLRPFCLDNPTRPVRFALAQPFVQDGWCYATDGRIAVRVPSDEPNTARPNERYPAMAKHFSAFAPAACTQRVPIRKVVRRCLRYPGHSIPLCGGRFDPHLLCEIAVLPHARVALERLPMLDYARGDGALQFVADGGLQGILLPMAVTKQEREAK